MLRINAGVTASQGNDGTGVDMNGVGRNGTVYSLDGTNASGNTGSNNPGAYQGGNLVDVMSVEGIQDVSAVKGAIPAEYEDAIGGQVNLVSGRHQPVAWQPVRELSEPGSQCSIAVYCYQTPAEF
jgi:hypothetical protein